MKKLLLLFGLVICLIGHGQDTIHVYPENSMIKITRLESNSIYINPYTASIRLVRDNIRIYDGSLKVEYDLTTYDKIFNIDTTGFASKAAVLTYLSGFISKINKPINNKLIAFNSSAAVSDSAIWIPTASSNYFVITDINLLTDSVTTTVKIYSATDTILNMTKQLFNHSVSLNTGWEANNAGDSIFINSTGATKLSLLLSGYEY